MARDGDGWTQTVWQAALGRQRLCVTTHTRTLTQLLGVRQVRERCSGDESVKHYSSGVWGSSGVEGRLTGWLILMLPRREEGRGRREERDEGWEGGMVGAHTHTHILAHRAMHFTTMWPLICPQLLSDVLAGGLRLEFPWHQLISFYGSISVLFFLHSPDLCCLPKLLFVDVWQIAF